MLFSIKKSVKITKTCCGIALSVVYRVDITLDDTQNCAFRCTRTADNWNFVACKYGLFILIGHINDQNIQTQLICAHSKKLLHVYVSYRYVCYQKWEFAPFQNKRLVSCNKDTNLQTTNQDGQSMVKV